MTPENRRDIPDSLTSYRLLGRSGVRVSPLCLGTMTFGTEWGYGADRNEAKRIFDSFIDKGGNFVDTANFYTNGTSESLLGEFIGPNRSRIVLGTKFTLSTNRNDPNAGGNHRKNMVQSIEASLKRLRTDYIDLYWLHAWEYRTPIDEVMRALDDLVRAGKVVYIGVSDTPAYKVAQANTLAELRGWSPFIALQIEYSLFERTVERELVPMAKDLGLGITPWSPLAGGLLSGKYASGKTATSEAKRDISKKLTDKNLHLAATVGSVAKALGKSSAQVALNWLLRENAVVSPIIGVRTLSQLEDNLGCLGFTIPPELLAELESVSAVEPGFPNRFLRGPFVQDLISGGCSIEERNP